MPIGRRLSRCCPRTPMALNNRAWTYATGPFIQRDPERAVALARRAVALAPGSALTLNTLGVALYRAGQYAEAISVLERSLAAGKGEADAYDLFFLAMAHHQLGHRQAGPRLPTIEPSVGWRSQKSLPESYTKELAAFRAEAESVLASPPDDLPADVFAPPPEQPLPAREQHWNRKLE